MTEFAADGHIVQEARWESNRLDTYRTYLSDWVGTPSSSPALKTFASANDKGQVSSTSYVSWNGATEVASWEFFGSGSRADKYHNLGTVVKTGFETSFVSRRAWKYTWVYAKNAKGEVLGKSLVTEIVGFEHVARAARQSPQYSDWGFGNVSKSRPPTTLVFGLSLAFVTLILALLTRICGPVSIRRLRRKLSSTSYHRRGYQSVSQIKTVDF